MAIVFESQTGNKDAIINEVHQLWADIYRRVALQQWLSTEALRFAATLRSQECPNKPLSEEEAAESLRDQSRAREKVIETTKWLKAVTGAVDRLLDDRRKNAVTQIAQARMVATAVYLRADLSEAERAKVLHRWENVTFRIYGMFGRDARTAVGDYVRLAWSIINEKLPTASILARLSSIGADYDIAGALDELRHTDCYDGWQEELRYFLFRYEEYLSSAERADLQQRAVEPHLGGQPHRFYRTHSGAEHGGGLCPLARKPFDTASEAEF